MPQGEAGRPISISICTCAQADSVKALLNYLKKLKRDKPHLKIKDVKVHLLPYNDLDKYRFFPQNPVDVMVLCHSVVSRRFAITDVLDSLYDKFLPYCRKVVGKKSLSISLQYMYITKDRLIRWWKITK